MLLPFTKMQGLGNDFIVFEAADDAAVPDSATFRALADRRTGIGFDQALVLMPARDQHTDVFYRIFNADGSEVEQCGNGARCIAALIAKKLGRKQVHLDSPGGRIDGVLRDDASVAIDMGIPNFDPAALPFEASREADVYPLRVGETELQIGAVSMGNPHAVLQVANVAEADVQGLGPAIETHTRFPNRVNVGFMQVLAPNHIRLRVFERGVGETQACGTGACAAVAVGRRLGLLGDDVKVSVPGGEMSVKWEGPGEHLWLIGPATTVFEGSVDTDAFRRSKT
ncbi:MAG TPA: diaminopimelate epimerase [Steroidobacteraceae bacterium]|jgi:diaminopimelate epimerase|nr:diaminopimelate epimerase [Steroidobacteraceae bacterium]